MVQGIAYAYACNILDCMCFVSVHRSVSRCMHEMGSYLDCQRMFAMNYLGTRRGCWECGGVLSTSGVTHIPAYTIAVLHNRLAFYKYALYLLSCLYDTALILICIILILCQTAKCACSLPIVARSFSDMLQYEQVTWHSVSM